LIIGAIWLFYRNKPANEVPAVISGLFPSSGEKTIEGLPGPSGNNEGENLPTGQPAGTEKILKQLTTNAITSATVASTSIRYMEKSTGHIYDVSPDGQNRLRLSNTTILKTFENFWSVKANKLIARYFEDSGSVKTFSFALGATSTISGIFFPQTITEMAVSPSEDKIFYLVSTDGAFKGITANFENKNQASIFSSPFGEFNIIWPKSDIITLLTKPSAFVPGFFYSINSKTGKFDKIIGDILGLTARLSPDGTRVIYSQSKNNSFTTKIFNAQDKTSVDFELTTLPEKCVWSGLNKNIVYCAAPNDLPAADYPDDWYQGLVFFSDSVWQKDFSNGATKILIQETNADIINPFLTKDESYLIFTNKTDNTLWSLKIK